MGMNVELFEQKLQNIFQKNTLNGQFRNLGTNFGTKSFKFTKRSEVITPGLILELLFLQLF